MKNFIFHAVSNVLVNQLEQGQKQKFSRRDKSGPNTKFSGLPFRMFEMNTEI